LLVGRKPRHQSSAGGPGGSYAFWPPTAWGAAGNAASEEACLLGFFPRPQWV